MSLPSPSLPSTHLKMPTTRTHTFLTSTQWRPGEKAKGTVVGNLCDGNRTSILTLKRVALSVQPNNFHITSKLFARRLRKHPKHDIHVVYDVMMNINNSHRVPTPSLVVVKGGKVSARSIDMLSFMTWK